MGRVVSLVTASDPARLWEESWRTLLGMAAVLLIARPLAQTGQNLVANQAISANVSNMIRWAEPLVCGTPVLGILPE